jgi:hypothetical protein
LKKVSAVSGFADVAAHIELLAAYIFCVPVVGLPRLCGERRASNRYRYCEGSQHGHERQPPSLPGKVHENSFFCLWFKVSDNSTMRRR